MKAFRKGCDRFGFRLVHYSIQGNHLHLLTEAEDRHALAKGMQGLLIRCAKALNRLWRRKGSVFADRYHNVVLDSPRRVRNALVYVLQNCRRHGARWRTRLDHFSSALWFRGWSGPARLDQDRDEVRPTTGPRSWLLRGGWKRRGGLISPTESPAPG